MNTSSGPLTRALRLGLAAAFAAAGSVAGVTLTAAPAVAAAPATCLGTVYAADNASGNIRPVSTGNGAVGPALYDGNLPVTGNPPTRPGTINQNGIGRGGAYAINANGGVSVGNIVDWTASTERTRTLPKQTATGVNAIAGAINPATAAYYYGGYAQPNGTAQPPTALVLWSYDRTNPNNAAAAPATRVTIELPTTGEAVPPGGNGDVAFGPDGTLYFVASAGSGETALYRLNAALPAPGTAATFPATALTELSRTDAIGGTTNATNGIAFASDGFLYLGRATSMTRVNPITGAANPTTPISFNTGAGNAAASSTDLASCANPNTVSITVEAPDGAQNPGDQFTGTLGGGSYDSPDAAPPPTATFPAGPGGPTSQPAIVLPGETYDVGVIPAAGNGPNPYAENYTCTDDVTGEVVAFGSGTSTQLTLPEGTGVSVNCVFSVEEPQPGIDLVKTVTPEQFDSVDDGPLEYTFTVRNTGNVPLEDFQLVDELEGLGPITCTPVAEGATLPARERVPGSTTALRAGQTVCTAERDITQEEVESRQGISNSASVSAAAPARFNVGRSSASDQVTSDNVVTDPTATNDAVGAQANETVTLPAASNDTPGSAPIDLAATRLLDADGNPVTSLTTPQGVFTVVTAGPGAGTVTFTPAAGATGTVTVPYRITDQNGFTDDGTLTVTIQDGPTATDDPAETDQGAPVLIPVLVNDTPGDRANGAPGAFDPASLVFPVEGQPAGSIRSADGLTLEVPGEGTYTAITTGPNAGQVWFVPEPDFADVATPVTYAVTDQAGNTVTAEITVTVDAVTPVANDDAAKTPLATPVVGLDVVANDEAGAATAPLDPASVVLTGPGAAPGGKTLVSADGTWTVDADGLVSFEPVPGFTGPTTVAYEVSDANGTTASATITIVVGEGPLAAPDAASTPQNTPVVVDVLGNDVPGDQGTPCTPPGSDTPPGCDTGTFDPDTLLFPETGQPAGAIVSPDGQQVTVIGVGTWTIVDGQVRFVPETGFTGPPPAEVTYQVTDSYGNVATGTVAVNVRAIQPVATNDTASTPFGTAVTLPGLLNDSPGTDDNGTPNDPSDDVTPPLVAADTVFPVAGQPADAVITNSGKTLTIEGQGTWQIQDDGSVVFTPAEGFTGPTSTITYEIADANGTRDTATLAVDVQDGPAALDDEATTTFATPVLLPVLANDTPGDDADGNPGAWDPATLQLVLTPGLPAGSEVSPDGLTLTVPGEGTWTVVLDGQDSGVRFTPAPGFDGTTTPIGYTIDDEFQNPVTAEITVEVLAGPSATDDQETTPQNVNVTLSPLANDTPGEPLTGEASFDVSTLAFDPDGLPAGSELSPDGLVLTVPGQGTWTIVTGDGGARTGDVVFDPEPGYVGTTVPVGYVVEDSVGNQTGADMTVEVTALDPDLVDDDADTPFQTDVAIDVLANDETAVTAPMNPTTVFLLDAQDNEVRELTVPGQGTFTVNPLTGVVTFAPVDGFSGDVAEVRYVASDINGTQGDPAIIRVVVQPGPSAVDDEDTTPQNTPVTLDPLANDTPGQGVGGVEGSFDETTVRFTEGGQPAGAEVDVDGLFVVVPGQGRWEIDPVTGEVTFTPEAGFTGPTSPVTYTVDDEFGNAASAQIVVTVAAVAPQARNDRARTPYETPVRLDVLANDRAGSDDAPLDPTTLALVDADGNEVPRLRVPGEGTWFVTANGQLRFVPADGFSGTTSPVTYTVSDSNGTATTATAVVVVEGPGEANPSEVTTSPGTAVTVPVLDNVTPAPGEDLRPGTVCIYPASITVDGEPADVGGRADRCVDEFTLDGVGTWVVNPDGTITFTPAPGFTGSTTIDFSVTDTAGNILTTTLTVDVTEGAAPPASGGDTPGSDDGLLPNTGGPTLLLLLAGLGLLAGGGAVVARSRRRA